LSSVVPPEGKLLVVANGAYGERMIQMASVLKIPTVVVRGPEDETPDLAAVEEASTAEPAMTHPAAAHCATATGSLNAIAAIGEIVARQGREVIVDAMSSFGAIPMDMTGWHIDYLISSANKCIEGVPGFAFALCRREALRSAEGRARSLSLDLLAQWKGLE